MNNIFASLMKFIDRMEIWDTQSSQFCISCHKNDTVSDDEKLHAKIGAKCLGISSFKLLSLFVCFVPRIIQAAFVCSSLSYCFLFGDSSFGILTLSLTLLSVCARKWRIEMTSIHMTAHIVPSQFVIDAYSCYGIWISIWD